LSLQIDGAKSLQILYRLKLPIDIKHSPLKSCHITEYSFILPERYITRSRVSARISTYRDSNSKVTSFSNNDDRLAVSKWYSSACSFALLHSLFSILSPVQKVDQVLWFPSSNVSLSLLRKLILYKTYSSLSPHKLLDSMHFLEYSSYQKFSFISIFKSEVATVFNMQPF